MKSYLPENTRIITLDLKGFGYSEKKCDDNLSLFDQSLILTEFIKKNNLDDFVLAGHSMGAAVCIITLFRKEIYRRVKKLIILDGALFFRKLPAFIDDLTSLSANTPFMKHLNEETLTAFVLKQAFYDENKIKPETIKAYSAILKQKDAKECLIAAARQIAIANARSFKHSLGNIKIPVLIIWGRNDRIIELKEAYILQKELEKSELKIIENCGHSPQEEKPEETAELIAGFLYPRLVPAKKEKVQLSEKQPPKAHLSRKENSAPGKFSRSIDNFMQASGNYARKLKMRNLIDRWSISAFMLIVFIKILQFLKKMGFTAKENGWRKATGIFLRNEYSKFILASFRLNYAEKSEAPETLEQAKNILITRLTAFLRKNPACHWTLEWGIFMSKRKKLYFTDIIISDFDNEGRIARLTPHLDETRPTFSMLNEQIIDDTFKQLALEFNTFRDSDDHKRAWIIYKRLKKWVRKYRGLSFSGRQELRHLIERALNATYIQFEVIKKETENITAQRLATPNMKNRKHPGFGLLNIICRLTPDLKEADLWLQHHHVSVDGMPMQEMLESLKEEWGAAGPLKYPALSSKAARPEIFYFGKKLFRARIYVCFEKLMKLRKYLNENYYSEMGGHATVSSMIIWGLSRNEYFRERKFLFPVDNTMMMHEKEHDRSLSLIFIRPSRYSALGSPLERFLKYQREFNQRLFTTRIGKSESYEILELYAIIHPLFYYVARYLMKKAMTEVVGTAGLTILKNAEMFVSPLTDLQIDGFSAIGNLAVPTEDGSTAGAVSICGSKKQVKEYINAFQHMAENYQEYLGIDIPGD
jgi:pimeloyl-ACP methyl ester carboxylesterase